MGGPTFIEPPTIEVDIQTIKCCPYMWWNHDFCEAGHLAETLGSGMESVLIDGVQHV